MKELKIKNSLIKLVQGDITEQDVDVIVNAANSQLVMGGGVAGAIRRKGGANIQKEASEKAPISVGEAVITNGGNLKANYVIHAVGPRMGEGNEDEKLKNATLSSLKVMDENNLQSIAFPAISTGIFGYPIEKCAKIMIQISKDYLSKETGIREVIFCLFTKSDFEIFETYL
ncbi:MAG: O-acetyl-ADP-ribose deacetylase [Candidatus Lokiarchaeota archaeon]|nr:O-acetyl-ADP-ribose deacetylase [Candidatus Lokiarchaeota archaeon]MBD3202500.1 O-acetyl-ADP-ribose deacetylase [Candidatus Lokiarchaeota archaeon]